MSTEDAILDQLFRKSNKSMDKTIASIGVFIACLMILLVLSGCNGLGAGNSTVTATPHTDVTTKTGTSTPPTTPTPSVTLTNIDPENWPQSWKYRYFTADYRDIVRDDVDNATATTENATINFTYTMREPTNATQNRDEIGHLLVSYSSAADEYISGGHEDLNEEWIPRRLNVTALHPETEEVYWRGHTNYTVMNRYRTGESTYAGYFLTYVQSLERGPAHPDYEGN